MCILSAVDIILKTKKIIKTIKATPFNDLPTIKMVCNRVCVQSSGTTYQGTEITNFEKAIEYFKGKYSDLVENVLVCLLNRIKVQCMEILSHI